MGLLILYHFMALKAFFVWFLYVQGGDDDERVRIGGLEQCVSLG